MSVRVALARILFSQGFGSRRECEGLVLDGRVAVGGEVVDDPDQRFVTEGLTFNVEGTAWRHRAHALVMLHKPVGYECSQKPSAWPSVMLLLPAPLRRRGVQPVGRLDQDTTGVLLLTDDGALIHRLTSPKHHVPKVYEVSTERPVDDTQITQLLAGVMLDDEPLAVRAEGCERTGEHALRLTLVQGKYHQVKRMIAAAGNHVTALHRSAFGALTLPPDLAPGRWTWIDDPGAIMTSVITADASPPR